MKLLRGLADWLDDRTGYRGVVHESLYEEIPGGARWIYVTGSMLVCAFVTQAITGLFLWMFYSAGSQNAWESVYWIENKVLGGWLLRGVHHYMAQGMVVLLPVHLLQVVLCRAYVKPREINYWTGLVLMLLTLALGLTGYLLPWDQKGYWATKVATELMSLPPGGGEIQKLVVGGPDYGHYTLTRFFAMHAGVLPALLVIVLGLHIAMFRKQGITAVGARRRPTEYFWPRQVLMDAIACLLLLGVVVGLVVWRGAELGPPAEPTESYGAARPEWYYLFLFQLLKHAPTEFIGAIVIPGVAMGFLFLLPLIAKVKFGHVVNVVTLLCLLIGAGYLTAEAVYHDNYREWSRAEPPAGNARALHHDRWNSSDDFHRAREQAEHEYARIRELIDFYGMPREGATLGLVRNDPEIQGPRIFKRNCSSCHSYLSPEGHGIPGPRPERKDDGTIAEDRPVGGAPNLYRFASREWLTGFLDPERLISSEYFGLTAHVKQVEGAYKSGGMVEFVRENLRDLSPEKSQDLEELIVALSAEAGLESQRATDQAAEADGSLARGKTALVEKLECTNCHGFHDNSGGSAPDLTGYGSADWLRAFISQPSHERFYPGQEPEDTAYNDRMPDFAKSTDPAQNQLSAHDLEMLVRWLRGDAQDLQRWEEIRGQR